MDKTELKDFLIDECGYVFEEVESMSNAELVDAWLKWEGVIGFTDDILRIVETVYEIELK